MLATDSAMPQEHRASKIILILAAAVILCAAYLNLLPGGMIGALGIMVILGYLLNTAGDRTPIINQFFGGGAIVVIFGSSYLFHSGFVDDKITQQITTFTKSGGFLSFYVASLVTGSIFGMSTDTLKKAALKYIPVILGAVAVSFLFAGAVGLIVGKNLFESVMLIALPIMGGGMGAGAVPLVEIMSGRTGMNAADLMSVMVPALAIGNAIAIVIAGVLHKVGQWKPSWTGNGELIRGQAPMVEDTTSGPLEVTKLGMGALLAISMFFLGTLLSQVISMHTYALMILSIALIKVSGLMPAPLEQAAHAWYKFVVSNLTPALLVGIGVAYTDLDKILEALTPLYFVMVFATVVGAVVGAGLVGRLMGFYPIESAITGGLCMANMGGTGDVAVLAASKRMQLMPFAQISSRIGGAFMLIVATFAIQILGG
ncbi:2-hydroxycarboxylate transporter family protein [Maribrevibacterium harenarium]|uniref:2-hydroxycarboxylate transporter family protein n=1 Tax=Maribrevibacterium harenarium TaxID=2589817 RepID=A0A501X4D9_9GAMM|nr:2-hydroxycarboxylate transporter family protein [Maribrevibacterium harenarium]TPE55376.1 2-hydroxycarboxylate transporter family protein [Maribrevibacterium harenarium]